MRSTLKIAPARGRRYFIVFFLMFSSIAVYSEAEDYPVVGKPCPDFKVTNIKYNINKTISLKSLKGKFVILDFFSAGCSVCFSSFSDLTILRKKFLPQLQIYAIGNGGNGVEYTYEIFRKRRHLELPVGYDSALFNRFVPFSVPHDVWIDSNGIVRALTSSTDVTEENIKAFLTGKPFSFSDRGYSGLLKRKAFEDSLKENENRTTTFGTAVSDTGLLYQSFLKRKEREEPMWPTSSITESLQSVSRRKFEAINVPLIMIYRYAYFDYQIWYPGDSLYGKLSMWPVFEIKDSSLFMPDYKTGKNMFTYSIVVPKEKANTKFIQQVIQSDLHNYFGYDAIVERRSIPVWELTTSGKPKEILKSKGGDSTKSVFTRAGFHIVNSGWDNVMRILAANFYYNFPPFIDSTHINGKIDIKVDAILNDFEAMKKELQRNGIMLTLVNQEMNVLVIRDPVKN